MIRKLLAVVLALLIGIQPAAAAVYHVGPAATGDGSGSDGSNLMTLGSVNAILMPGDIAKLHDGTHPYFIAPARSGTAGAYITYEGNLTNRQNVTVSGITLGWHGGGNLDVGNDFVSVKGVRGLDGLETGARDGLAGDWAIRDSIINVKTHGLTGLRAARDLYVVNSTLGDSALGSGLWTNPGENHGVGNKGGHFNNVIVNAGGGSWMTAAMVFSDWDSLQIGHSNMNGIVWPGNGNVFSFIYYGGKYCNFHDNLWTNRYNRANGRAAWREFFKFNTYERDSFVTDSAGLAMGDGGTGRGFDLSNSGSNPNVNAVSNNLYLDCYFEPGRTVTAQDGWHATVIDGGSIICNDCGAAGAINTTSGSGPKDHFGGGAAIRNAVIQNKTGPALVIKRIGGGTAMNYIEGNTFYGVPNASGPAVVMIDPTEGWNDLAPLTMRNNIYYSSTGKTPANALSGLLVRFPTTAQIPLLTSNYNLYANWFGTQADHAIAWATGSGLLSYSRPGATSLWANTTIEDINSVAVGNGAAAAWLKGPMGFTNQTSTDSLAHRFHVIRANATPKTPSAALGTGTNGRDIGAITSTPDNTRPGPINDVIIGMNGVAGGTIQWSAVGDDSLTGNAHHYEIRGRWAATPTELTEPFEGEDEDNVWPILWRIAGPPAADPAAGKTLMWSGSSTALAMTIPTGPTPGAPGTVESFSFTGWVTPEGVAGRLRDLSGGYFGVWVAAVDEAGHHSTIATNAVMLLRPMTIFPVDPPEPPGYGTHERRSVSP